MGTLADILSSRVREAIFQLLFGQRARELHLRELARQSGFSLGTVRQELQKLLRLGLVRDRQDGNRLYYRANTEHPLYPDICRLVLKTVDMAEILQNALNREGVQLAFIFGSAGKKQRTATEVNLMVLGDVDRSVIWRWLSGVPFRINRTVVLYAMKVEEFRRRQEKGDQFVAEVLESPKLFIIGTEEELAGKKH